MQDAADRPELIDTTAPSQLDFDDFYREHHEHLTRAMALTLDDAALGTRAVDEAFTRAYGKWNRVVLEPEPSGWVYRVGLDWAHSWRRSISGSESKPVASPDPQLDGAIAGLPTEYRSVFIGRCYLDWSTEQAAAALRLPEETVDGRLTGAVTRLRESFGPELSDLRIRSHLRERASLVVVDEADQDERLDEIEARSEERRRRRFILNGAAVVLVLAGVGAAALSYSTPPTGDLAAPTATITVPTTLPSVPTTEDSTASTERIIPEVFRSDGPTLTWTEVELPLGVSPFGVRGTDDEFLTLRSGGPSEPVELWRSVDGRTWSVEEIDLPITPWDIKPAGDALVIRGSVTPTDAPSIGANGFVPLLSESWLSTDDGRTWTEIELPEPVTAGQDVERVTETEVSVAVLGDLTVVSRVTATEPLDESDSGRFREPVWELFRSVNGEPFELVDLPTQEGVVFSALTAGENTMLLNVLGPAPNLFISTDGTEWAPVSSPSLLRQPVRSDGATLIAISTVTPTAKPWESFDDGFTWEPIPDLPGADYESAVRTSDGLTVVAFDPQTTPGEPSLRFAADGHVITIEDRFLVTNETTGAVVLDLPLEEIADDGVAPGVSVDPRGQIRIYDPETDETFMSFTEQEFNDATFDQRVVPGGPPRPFVGYTSDGTTFGWQSMDELVGDNSFVTLIATDDVVLAAVGGGRDARLFVAEGS